MFESAKNVMNQFVEGVSHINLSGDVVHEMSEEENNIHVFGVIMAQKLSLKAGLKKFIKQTKQAVTKELK